MKIALITENSQAAKNETIHSALTAVATPFTDALLGLARLKTRQLGLY